MYLLNKEKLRAGLHIDYLDATDFINCQLRFRNARLLRLIRTFFRNLIGSLATTAMS